MGCCLQPEICLSFSGSLSAISFSPINKPCWSEKKKRLLDILRVSISNFVLGDAPAGNHGSCIHHLGLFICYDEYNYHESLQAHLIKGAIGH